MREDKLSIQSIDFSVDIINLVKELKSKKESIISNRIGTSGTSEEHFQLYGLTKPLNIGDMVKLIPGHCCSTVNLHEKIYLIVDDKVVGRLLITARGMGK